MRLKKLKVRQTEIQYNVEHFECINIYTRFDNENIQTFNINRPVSSNKMKESDAEYAKVTIIIASPESNSPTKIQRSPTLTSNIDEIKRQEIKKQSDNIEDTRAKRERQDKIGLFIVFRGFEDDACDCDNNVIATINSAT